MTRLRVRRLTRHDGSAFLRLIDSLADYEKLKRPSAAARARLLRDATGRRKRFDAFLAFAGDRAVGYAIVFETYSSFLALPTLYLEDLFVLPDYRSKGVGWMLFRRCVAEAKRRDCGRMEWMVLDWNQLAIDFYERVGATRMKNWVLYRIPRENFPGVLGKARRGRG